MLRPYGRCDYRDVTLVKRRSDEADGDLKVAATSRTEMTSGSGVTTAG
jgi:hypothetical protein